MGLLTPCKGFYCVCGRLVCCWEEYKLVGLGEVAVECNLLFASGKQGPCVVLLLNNFSTAFVRVLFLPTVVLL